MERFRKEKKIFDLRWSSGGHRRSRLGFWLVVLATTFCITGCMTLKKAGVTSVGAVGGAIVGSVLSSGAIAPIAGATAGAFVTDAMTEVTMSDKKNGTILQTEQRMIECAPYNFFTLLGKLVEMGGWLLILVVLVPMVLGWILPGPLERKKK